MSTAVPAEVTARLGRLRRSSEGAGSGRLSRRRRIALWAGAVVVLLAAWEAVKWLGGDPWRFPNALGLGLDIEHFPPFDWPFATDLFLPHWWDIIGALAAPVQRNQEATLAQFLVGAAFYTWREAGLGFLVGAALGLVLATLFVHSRLLERAFVPYVVASQTIPIVALAPMIVLAFGQSVTSVVIIATYLTFFPVTIAMIRGLRSPDPRALELMRSYAASRWAVYWKVRLPASVPYLFTALKIAATASIVGAIIGEGPGGIPDGLGRAIINFNQQYITAPEKLWAAILVSSLLGVAFFILVRVAELVALRGRPAVAEG
ncbi:MAG TPA: ABC transporter permease [Clostridia bacterium]|nr:ABC transporter permease [Clostridia bacterium]